VRVDKVDKAVADELHDHWLHRRPVVVELAMDAAELRTPEVEDREPWALDPTFEFTRERLQFLVWANNYDGRAEGEPIWWWDRKAARIGTTDLPVDGGPHQPLAGVVHRESVDLGRLTLVGDAPPSADLAPDQLAAVSHIVGPARVIAPAGSGKTRILTERLRHLIRDRHVEPETVLAVAYNKRAADELVERTTDLPGAHIRTVNALGLAICNASGRRETIDEREVRRIVDGLVEVRRAQNTDPLAPYLEALSAIRLGLTDPDAVEAAFPDAEGVAAAFPRYCAILDDHGWLDFDHQVYEAIRVLLRDPAIRGRFQGMARHLLVDEFQDLKPAELLLLRLIAAPGYDVFGVGDDDQVIYGYAGADPEFLVHFERYFPGASPHALEVNYRCPPAVVDAVRHLLSYNDVRIDKATRAAPGREGREGELVLRHGGAEAAVAQVDRWLGDGGADAAPSDIAVLARVNAALLPVQVTLSERGVPVAAPLDERILTRTGIRAALAYLRMAADPGALARSDVLDTVRRPSRKIARNVVEMVTKRPATSVHEMRRLASRLSGRDVERLERYAADIEWVADSLRSGGVAAALRTIRTGIGLGQAMDVLDGSRREADRSTHADDLVALEAVAGVHPEAATFEPWLREVLSRPGDPTGVQLSTIHRVKGRQWPFVVVYGVNDSLLPHRLATDESEERRIFHVAITRASSEVVVLSEPESPSPFLDELTGARERRPIRVRRPAASAPVVAPASAVDADPDVREALRAWRKEVASKDGMPAYVILKDADLDGIAAALPRSLDELAQCRGIGPAKLDRYGDELLAVIDAAAGKR
jgi:DNA helicase-2/ATP-dependent DNA helicase PcrA